MVAELLSIAGWGWAGVSIVMAATFLAGRALRNYGIVDAVWTLQFAPLAVWYAVACDAPPERQAAVVAMVALWSLRLGLHLARRVAAAHPEEDKRYRALRERWAPTAESRMFAFYQLQGVFAVVLSLPLLLTLANPEPFPSLPELLGISLFVVALFGEAVADAQLRRCLRVQPAGVCREGLWKYSRHPNYFFEWLVWVAWATCAIAAPLGWAGLIAPAAMLHLLLNVTGIPPTEASSLASRGAAYRDYQHTTSAFFPWPPRHRTRRT